jgi:uncharacterized protein HemX
MRWKPDVRRAERWLSAASLVAALVALACAYVFYVTAGRVSRETRASLQNSLQQELARQRRSQEKLMAQHLEDMKARLERLEEQNREQRARLDQALPSK